MIHKPIWEMSKKLLKLYFLLMVYSLGNLYNSHNFLILRDFCLLPWNYNVNCIKRFLSSQNVLVFFFFFFLLFVSYSLHSILYQFQVHGIMARHLYNLRSDPLNKSSTHVILHIVIIISLIVFLMWYFTALVLNDSKLF